MGAMMQTIKLPTQLSEKGFQVWVTDLATRLGWTWVHIPTVRVANGGRTYHATTYEGHPGLPDLILARDGKVLLVELKRHNGKTTPAQDRWLREAGGHARLWRPKDAPAIYAELRGQDG
jgi:hypothetical protein